MFTKLSKLFLTLMLVMLAIQPAFAQQKHKADLVVVGSGLAGITAAVYASENGLDVILIEKLPGLGGVMHFVEGTFAIESHIQNREMVGVTKEDMFVRIMDYSGWKADSALVRRIVNNTANTLLWLEDRGIKFNNVQATMMGGDRLYHNFEVGRPGTFYANTMANIIKKNGGKIFTEMRATELITDKNGNVIGVMAEDEEEEMVRFEAKAVLLATGSISSNKELRTKYSKDIPYEIPNIGLKTNVGDGVIMGQKIGADVAHVALGSYEGAVPVNVDYGEMFDNPAILDAYMALKNMNLWLNDKGQRFVNEAYAGDFTIVSNSLIVNGNTQIAIFDEEMKKDMMYGSGASTNYFIMYAKGQLMKHLDIAIEDGLKRGYAFKADSIEELAEQMGMDPEVIEASVNRYNDMAKKGNDEDFGKDPRLLKPIVNGPFYALKGINTICDGLGGLKINRNAQVLHTNGQPIKGLYAAGATSGGMLAGDDYPYIVPGYASAVALNTGRFAVEHLIVDTLGKKMVKVK